MTDAQFEKYKKKLLTYCWKREISVVQTDVKSMDNDAMFERYGKEIIIGMFDSKTNFIASMLHELGHFLDTKATPKYLSSNRIDSAYKTMLNRQKLTSIQKQIILGCETRAWIFAEGLANLLKIKIDNEFFEHKENALKNYKEAFDMLDGL